jgi:hypothetical protein
VRADNRQRDAGDPQRSAANGEACDGGLNILHAVAAGSYVVHGRYDPAEYSGESGGDQSHATNARQHDASYHHASAVALFAVVASALIGIQVTLAIVLTAQRCSTVLQFGGNALSVLVSASASLSAHV